MYLPGPVLASSTAAVMLAPALLALSGCPAPLMHRSCRSLRASLSGGHRGFMAALTSATQARNRAGPNRHPATLPPASPSMAQL